MSIGLDCLRIKDSTKNAVSAYPFVAHIKHSTKSGMYSATIVAWCNLRLKVLCKKYQEYGQHVHSWSCDLQLYSLPKTYPKIPPY
jgi:hypothetical protein